MSHRFVDNPGAGQQDAAVSHTSVYKHVMSHDNTARILYETCKTSWNTLANVQHCGAPKLPNVETGVFVGLTAHTSSFFCSLLHFIFLITFIYWICSSLIKLHDNEKVFVITDIHFSQQANKCNVSDPTLIKTSLTPWLSAIPSLFTFTTLYTV